MSQAIEIRVMASAAFKETYLELVPQFERATGHKVVTSWIPSARMMTRLKGGETPDIAIMSAAALDELVAHGMVGPGERYNLAKSGVAMAVCAGAHVRAQAPHAAKALIGFLTAPAAAPVIRKKGMEPVS